MRLRDILIGLRCYWYAVSMWRQTYIAQTRISTPFCNLTSMLVCQCGTGIARTGTLTRFHIDFLAIVWHSVILMFLTENVTNNTVSHH